MKRILLYLLLIIMLASCDNFLEVGPNTSELDTELVFKNDNTAIAALEAIYHELQFNSFASGSVISITNLGNILADYALEYYITNDIYYFNIYTLFTY